MSFFQQFARAISKAVSGRPAPTVPNRQPIVPPQDSREESPAAEVLRRTPATGLLVMIEYQDATGQRSSRRVTVYEIREKNDHIYLHCYCHERSAPRMFRMDRIAAVIDPHTGEVFDNPEAYFRQFDERPGPDDPYADQAKAFEMVAPGVLVLMSVAWADGQLHPSEAAVVERYIDAVLGRASHARLRYDVAQVKKWALQRYPTVDIAHQALDELLQFPTAERKELIDLIAEHAIELMNAHEGVQDAEFDALKKALKGWGSLTRQ